MSSAGGDGMFREVTIGSGRLAGGGMTCGCTGFSDALEVSLRGVGTVGRCRETDGCSSAPDDKLQFECVLWISDGEATRPVNPSRCINKLQFEDTLCISPEDGDRVSPVNASC
jgi:hypothetical protein